MCGTQALFGTSIVDNVSSPALPVLNQEEILPVENEEAASLKDFEPQVEEEPPGKLRQICIFPPQGIFAEIVTNGMQREYKRGREYSHPLVFYWL